MGFLKCTTVPLSRKRFTSSMPGMLLTPRRFRVFWRRLSSAGTATRSQGLHSARCCPTRRPKECRAREGEVYQSAPNTAHSCYISCPQHKQHRSQRNCDVHRVQVESPSEQMRAAESNRKSADMLWENLPVVAVLWTAFFFLRTEPFPPVRTAFFSFSSFSRSTGILTSARRGSRVSDCTVQDVQPFSRPLSKLQNTTPGDSTTAPLHLHHVQSPSSHPLPGGDAGALCATVSCHQIPCLLYITPCARPLPPAPKDPAEPPSPINPPLRKPAIIPLLSPASPSFSRDDPPPPAH